MKIAVLLFGQPRFIEHSINLLREEFQYDNTNFDFFAHFWKDTTFSTKGEYSNNYIDYTNIIESNIHKLNIKRYVIDNFKSLDDFVIHIENTLRVLTKKSFNKTDTYEPDRNCKRYKWGQHLSLLKCFNLLKGYERKHNFQYDIIIKARTDFIYKNILCYKTEKKYLDKKYANYLAFSRFDVPCAITTGLQFQHYINNNWKNKKQSNTFKYSDTDWIRDDYNIFRTGDISLAVNRLAADHYFGDYFITYLNTFIKDKINNTTKIYDRHDAVQGDIAINFDILVNRIECRFHRLVHYEDHKKGWFSFDKNVGILVERNTSTKDIQKQLIKHSNSNKIPAVF
jgi:hypothetical protein